MEEGDFSLGEHKQNFAHTKTEGKGAVTPQDTEPKSPARVGGLPVEARDGMGTEALAGSGQ